MRKLATSAFVVLQGLFLLSGCASNTPVAPQTAATANGSAEKAAMTDKAAADKAAPAPAPQAAPAVAVPNPAVVGFEKMSVTLDDKARQAIALYAERAKSSRKVIATGFCDHKQVANSPTAALRRAVVVRDELIRLGVDPARIQVKYSTSRPKLHAVEISFE